MSAGYYKKRLSGNQEKPLLRHLLLFVAACLLFFPLYQLNLLFPLYADDWSGGYQQLPPDFTDLIRYIWETEQQRYHTWGGRLLVHSIAKVLAWLGTGWSNLINILVFVLLVYTIYRIGNYSQKTNPVFFLLIGLLFWICTPGFHHIVFWMVGSANYLWGTFICILFLYPFYTFLRSPNQNNNILKSILFFPAGIAAGWTNENMFVALLFFAACTMVLLKKGKHNIPFWMFTGIAGVFIGGAFMLSAPGNFARAAEVSQVLGLENKSLVENIGYRIMKTGYRYVVYILPLTLVYLFLFFASGKRIDKSIFIDKQLSCSVLFLLTAHIACFAMCASPIFPPRATFGIITLLITAIAILYTTLSVKSNVQTGILSIFVVVSAVLYYNDYKNFGILSSIFREREIYIQEQKALGNKNIVFYNRLELPERYEIQDLSDDPTHWLNQSYSDYHDIDSVRVVSEENK